MLLAECDAKFSKTDCTPVALILLQDNIRKDAPKTIEWFKQNNVDIKIISGDNPITVSQIAKQVGIAEYENYIDMSKLKSIQEVEEAATLITSSAHPDANIIWGAAFDTNLVDEMKITVIATGFDTLAQKQPEAKPVAETKNSLGINNWFDDNNKGHISTEEDDDYLNDVISILKRNSGK